MTDWAKLKQEMPSEVDGVNDIPEEFRYLYDKGDNGKYQFKGSQPLFNAMTGAKSDKQELQGKLAEVQAQIGEFSKLGDLKDLATLKAKEKELLEAQAASNGQLDQLKAQSQESIKNIETNYQGQVTGLKGALQNTIKDNLIQGLVAGANLTKEGQLIIPQLLPQYFKIELGDNYTSKVVVVGEDGKARLNAKMDAMKPVEIIDELREKFPSLFAGRGSSGGGSQQTDDTALVPTDKKPSTWTPAQKSAYQQEHGYKAYEDLCRTEAASRAQEINDKIANHGKKRQSA